MQIRHVIIKVDDQDKALDFYTTVLGFEKKNDIPMGPVRWVSVTSREGAEGVELVLKPNSFPQALAAQKALYDADFPAAVFTTNDIDADFQRLKNKKVFFLGEPKITGPVTSVFFKDTCGNIIALVQEKH